MAHRTRRVRRGCMSTRRRPNALRPRRIQRRFSGREGRTNRGFAEVRLGLGRQPARNTIELPDGKRAPRDLFAELKAATEAFRTVNDVPIVGIPGELGALGIAGPRMAMLGVARALLAQFTVLHSPAEMVVAGFRQEHPLTATGIGSSGYLTRHRHTARLSQSISRQRHPLPPS